MPTLHWLTRDADIHAAARVPYRLLEEAPDLSTGDPDAGNMRIYGDNLKALKALLPFYADRVKCTTSAYCVTRARPSSTTMITANTRNGWQ